MAACDLFVKELTLLPYILIVLNVVYSYSEPGPPDNVKAYAINSTAIHVQWAPPLKPNGPLKLYTVLYEESKTFPSDNNKESVMPNITEAFIGNLEPFTNYTVKVKVQNNVASKDSPAVTVRTRPSGNFFHIIHSYFSPCVRMLLKSVIKI